MIKKKEALQLRQKELKKKWKKKYFQLTLKKLPLKFQNNYKTYNEQISKLESTYISGEAGVGKTVTAAFMFLEAVKNLYLEKGYYPSIAAHFVNFPDLFNEMQKRFKDYSYHELYDSYLDCDILVIDDIGAKKTSDWVGDVLYHIINRRYENELFTLITSNLSLSELADRLQDDRIIRRIEDSYQIAKKEHYSKS